MAYHARSTSTAGKWLRTWLVASGSAAAASTLLDLALLQRKINFLTGGFLAVDHVRNAAEALLFVATSWAVDFAAVGALSALVLWAAARSRLPRDLSLAAAALVPLVPIVIVNLIEYQVLAYIGDAFDFWLLFGLAGGDPREMVAVASGHLPRLAGMAMAAVAGLAGGLWALSRWRARQGRAEPAVPGPVVPGRRLAVAAAACAAAGLVVTAGASTASDVLDNGLRRKPAGGLFVAALNRISDIDGDGYGLLSRPRDPNPFDARVHPYAVDLPGNGIDENGIGGDLPPGEPYTEAQGHGAAWLRTPDVVLVMLESVRADAVGSRYEGRPVTPVLDDLVRRGISVPLAFSHNGYTGQSRQHTFTGSLAWLRGDRTLIDDFNANGYETAYFSGQDDSFGSGGGGTGAERADVSYDARSDVDRRYTASTTPGSLGVPAGVVLERVEAFLTSRTAGRPLFLYVNFHDTHFPYTHHLVDPVLTDVRLPRGAISPGRRDALRATYLNTVSYVDRAVGDLLAMVTRTTGTEPAIIVLSDHGESLYDDGLLGHGFVLSDEQTRIPLIVANLPVVIEEPFAQADLRDAVRAALASPDAPSRPAVIRNPERRVFQYLGSIERPAQIAFTSVGGRTIYDFRSNRVQINGTRWRRPGDLDPRETEAFLVLVHAWERMMLARHHASAD